MTTERPTPETDAVWADKSQNILEHAQRLERERDELLDRLTGLELRMPEELARLESERNEAQAQVKRIQDQLHIAMWVIEKQEQIEQNP